MPHNLYACHLTCLDTRNGNGKVELFSADFPPQVSIGEVEDRVRAWVLKKYPEPRFQDHQLMILSISEETISRCI